MCGIAVVIAYFYTVRTNPSYKSSVMSTETITQNIPGKEHEVLDFSKCEELFKTVGKRLDGQIITCPYDIYVNETLRKRYGYDKTPGKPVDLFVWSKGEPEKRYLTQVGGLPFLPENRPWPMDSKGQPRIFVGQLSFVDCKDILPVPMPGDVLLIFAEKECYDDGYFGSYNGSGEAEGLYFEWVNRENTVPWSREAIREKNYPSVPLTIYGVTYRGMDHFQDQEIEAKLDADYAKNIVWSTYHIPAFGGTKIGGIPRFIQNGPSDYDTKTQKAGDAVYIGQLTSVQATSEVRFPWCNRPKSLPLGFKSEDTSGPENEFMIGDMGDIYFFLKPNGEIVWCEECY